MTHRARTHTGTYRESGGKLQDYTERDGGGNDDSLDVFAMDCRGSAQIAAATALAGEARRRLAVVERSTETGYGCRAGGRGGGDVC